MVGGGTADRHAAVSPNLMQVRGAVLNGVLRPGSALPSSRTMASRLGVARACVVAAYDQLSTEGYVETRLGSGTFVRADLQDLVATARRRTRAGLAKPRPVPAPAKAFAEFERSATYAEGRPFNTGRTLIDTRTGEAWRKLTHQAVRSLGAYDLGYTDPAGSIELRASICEDLQAARAVRCQPEQIVITAGTQHAIDIAIRVALAPGDDVWVEDPGYPLTHVQLLLAKVRPHAVPVDRHGIGASSAAQRWLAQARWGPALIMAGRRRRNHVAPASTNRPSNLIDQLDGLERRPRFNWRTRWCAA